MNTTQGSADNIAIEARAVSKRYGATVALDNVNFRVRRGAVNVLIGENGAGKSTLMRLLAGAEQPSSGEIWKDGSELALTSPRDAKAAGIAIVYQELAVMENLNVAENIFAGRELVHRAILVDSESEERLGAVAMSELGKQLSMRHTAGDLSLGSRQIIELARSIASSAQVLILDEPTSALSDAEAATLFRVVEDLKVRGVAIIYISHRLHELLYLGDFFTVLRDGRVVGEEVRGNVDRRWIVERMSGRAASETEPAHNRILATDSVPRLQVSNLRVEFGIHSSSEGLTMQVAPGEIVGIYGLLGAGRTDFLETLGGLRGSLSGELRLNGREVSIRNVRDALAAGIALVPEDRQRDGLVPELSIRENISLSALGSFAHRGWLSRPEESERVRQVAVQMRLSARDLELPVTSLSGGNQQKVILARCLMRQPRVLLLDEPTRGVDVGAKSEIYRALRSLADQGLSILFVTSEIEEARMLADRILVMTQGRIVKEFTAGEANDESLFAAACPTMETVV